MRALIVTPSVGRVRTGNRVTAERWAGMLRDLGHRADVATVFDGQPADLLVALHARKSAASIARFDAERPAAPLVVALTGTDLYGDLGTDPETRRSVELADRLIVLQPRALRKLAAPLRSRTHVIPQSVPRVAGAPAPRRDRFEVCVLGHLREVKDPLRAAAAARLLPPESRVHVVQIGAVLQPELAGPVRDEQRDNPRYEWLGELPGRDALRRLAACRLLALTSRMEGGANAVTEALVHDVPVVSTRIDGSLGLLGEDYPGYFPVGDTAALAALLGRAETDAAFYRALRERCRELTPSFEPAREREAWRTLIAGLAPDHGW